MKRTPRLGPRALFGALVAFAVVVLAPLHAEAAFRSAATGTVSAASDTLAGPGAVTISKTCVVLLLGPAKLNAGWTVSPSAYATGYTVAIFRNGVLDSTNAVSGRNTTSAIYTVDNNVTYTFTVSTVYRNWTSVPVPAPSAISCTLSG